MVYPIVYTRQMGVIHRKMSARGGDVEQFKQRMDRPWIRATLWLAPVAGAVLIVLGLTN